MLATSLGSEFSSPGSALAFWSCCFCPLLLSAATRTDQAGMQTGNGCLTPGPSPCTQTLRQPPRLCQGTGKTSGKSLSTQPAALAAPLTPVCAQCTPTHACASLCKCDSPSCTPAPPAIRLSVCPPPAPTEHPSLPPSLLPQSVSAVSPLINLERCHGDAAMGRSGCGAAEGPRPTGRG